MSNEIAVVDGVSAIQNAFGGGVVDGVSAIQNAFGGGDQFSLNSSPATQNAFKVMDQLHLFQGTPSESEKYGLHKPGEFVSTTTMAEITNPEFIPVLCWHSWVMWERDANGKKIIGKPQFVTTDPNDARLVGKLEWNNATGTPPEAEEAINFVGIFTDGVVRKIRFRVTSLTSGAKLKQAVSLTKGRMKYKLQANQKNSDSGVYRILGFFATTAVSDDEYAQASQMRAELAEAFQAMNQSLTSVEQAEELAY